MAELKVTFKLSERDVQHLRRIMRKASAAARTQDEESIIKAGAAMAAEVRKFKPPRYVVERVEELEALIQILEDKDWAVPIAVRQRIVSALCYFSHPADLIRDTIPGLGFLDDAIMIELATQELKHEVAAYRRFCRIRDVVHHRPWTKAGAAAQDRTLVGARQKLRAQVEARTRRDARRAGRRSPFRIW